MEGYGRYWKLELNPTDYILSLLNAFITEYCFSFGKCNERTNGQKHLCIELRYAQLKTNMLLICFICAENNLQYFYRLLNEKMLEINFIFSPTRYCDKHSAAAGGGTDYYNCYCLIIHSPRGTAGFYKRSSRKMRKF